MDNDPAQDRLVFVIRATNIVETTMKRIIVEYAQVPPIRSDFVLSHLLNNATVPFGSKVKLVLAIAKNLSIKVDRDAMHTLLSRRNAFAHQDHLSSVRLVSTDSGAPEVAFVVESVKSSGELETVTQDKAFADFVNAYAAVESDLQKLLTALGIARE